MLSGVKSAVRAEVQSLGITVAISKNVTDNANERRRQARSRETLFEDAGIVVSGENAELALSRKLLVSEVRAAVDSLPLMWREVIVMRDMEDLSYAEIAAILNCPIGTVMSRLARGREALRQLLMPRVPEVRR